MALRAKDGILILLRVIPYGQDRVLKDEGDVPGGNRIGGTHGKICSFLGGHVKLRASCASAIKGAKHRAPAIEPIVPVTFYQIINVALRESGSSILHAESLFARLYT